MMKPMLFICCLVISCIWALSVIPCMAAGKSEPAPAVRSDADLSVLATYRTSSDYSPRYKPLYSLLSGQGPLHSAYLPGGIEPAPEFAFHTALEDSPHIIIDLHEIRMLDGLRIENRRRQFQERARGLTVWLSTDGVSWREVVRFPDPEPIWTVTFDRNTEVRFIKIGLQCRDYLHLARVEVLEPAPDVPAEQPPERDPRPAGPMRQIVGPGSAVQRIEFDGLLTIQIPPGTVTGPEELVVVPDPELPPEGAGDLDVMASFDITLGSRHEFDQDLVLEVPYRPEWFESPETMQRQIVAARWDDRVGAWIELPVEVDAGRSVLRVTTNHLSMFGWFFRIRAWGYRTVIADRWYSVLKTLYFTLYFDESALAALPKIRNWNAKSPEPAYFAEAESIFEPIDTSLASPGETTDSALSRIKATSDRMAKKYVDGMAGYRRASGGSDGTETSSVDRVFKRKPRQEIRPFINTLVWYLNSSFRSYETAGIALPLEKMPIPVFLTTSRSGDTPAFYCTETGTLTLRADPTIASDATSAGFLHTIAHEVFHAFQGAPLEYRIEKMTQNTALWWIESTAEYAACALVRGFDLAGNPSVEALPDIRNRIGGGGAYAVWPYLAEYPITYAGHAAEYQPSKDQGNNLEYDRGWMIRYMMARIKDSFRDGFKSTQETFLEADTPFPAFKQWCIGRKLPVAELQREFAAWLILGKESPLARIQPGNDTTPKTGRTGIPLLSVVKKNNGRPDVCRPGPAGSLLGRFNLAAGYTSKAWAVKAARPADGKPVTLEVRAETVPPDTFIDVFKCPGNNRLTGLPLHPTGSLTLKGQFVNIAVSFGQHDDLEIGVNNAPVFCDDIVYIIMTNADETRSADVEVSVSQVVPPTPAPAATPPPATPASKTPSGDPVDTSYMWHKIDSVIHKSQDYNLADYSRQSGSAGDGSVCSREEWTLGDTTGVQAGCMTWSCSPGLDILIPGMQLEMTATIRDDTGQGEVNGWIAFQPPGTGWNAYSVAYQPLIEVAAQEGRNKQTNRQKIPSGMKDGETILLRARITAGRSSITFDQVYEWRPMISVPS